MTQRILLDRPTQALNRALNYRAGQHPMTGVEAAPPALTVALAREPGTPVGEVAHEVGARLGWPVYDHEIPERIAHDLGQNVRLIERIDERGQSWLVECVESFTLAPHVTESSYVHHLVGVIRALATRGNCVIVGRGAAQMLPARSALRVRLVGEREDRIADVGRRLHLDWDHAARKLDEISRQRTRFIRDHFNKDPDNPHDYDLVLNTSHWSVPECADLILQALQRLQERATQRRGTAQAQR